MVAMDEGITQHEISKRLDMFTGTVSRNMKILGEYDVIEHGEVVTKGYGLIEQKPHRLERRRMACYLTKRGRELKAEIIKIMEE